jgi:class 3 adenylate cyclase/tetratricopeptide (TPR) repeat protein
VTVAVVRRRVTIVASDLVGSTSLGETLDPEALREVLTEYFDEMRRVFEAHGGQVIKIIGDAIVVAFGLPLPRSDDAARAVAAADDSLRALGVLNERLDAVRGVRLTIRTGVASGSVVVGEATVGERVLAGRVMQLAGRLEQSAPAMGVLLSASTVRLAGPGLTVESVEVTSRKPAKRASPLLRAYRLVRMDPAAGRAVGDDPAGAALATPRAADSRRVVTIVFCDMKATTVDDRRLPAHALATIAGRSFAVARHAVEHHGGTVETFIGDAVMAVFGLPTRHEDDPLRAVRAALDTRDGLVRLAAALADEGILLRVAIGVNTGEVVAGDVSQGQRLATGDAVNLAARLEQAAPANEVLLGDSTHRLVRGAVTVEPVAPLTLKGKARPVPAHRLLGLVGMRPDPAAGRGHDTPVVGRDRELAVLREAARAASDARRCRMVTVVGEAGVGKTRLAAEFLSTLPAGVRVVRGRCLAYGDGITFWPVAEAVRDAAGIAMDASHDDALRRLRDLLGDEPGDVVDRIAAVAGLTATPFPVADLFWGVRRFLEVLGRPAPLVVLFEDVHWAAPTFLDLVRYLVDSTEDAPVAIVCTARRELLETQPGWAQRAGEELLLLTPLTEPDAATVVDNLLGRAGLAAPVRDAIVRVTAGNPLFVEQLLAMLIDDGTLQLEDGRWVAPAGLSGLAIPPTIQALLAARLDALPERERAVIEPASVIGMTFALGALRELAPDAVRSDAWSILLALDGRELIRTGSEASDVVPAHAFRHAYIRDVASAGLLRRTRAGLHERFVAWADRVNAEAGRAIEFEEILGYHLEEAYRDLAALGRPDDHVTAVGIDAAGRLGAAGDLALARGDLPAAADLLRRAASLLPTGHPARPGSLLQLGYALIETGDHREADEALDDAARSAVALADVGLATRARLERLLLHYLTDPTSVSDVEAQVRDAIAILEGAGDATGLSHAWQFVANLRIADARWADAQVAQERVVEYARRAGDAVRMTRAGSVLAACACFGPTPVAEALPLCEALLAAGAGDRASQALVRRAVAQLLAMRGDFVGARAHYRAARKTLDELGWTFQATLTSLDSGPIEMLAGDPAAAEAELRRDHDTLAQLGERNYISTVDAFLAEALYRLGRREEADHFSASAAEIAAPDDLTTQFLWRGVRAKLAAEDGRTDEALVLAREGVELSRRSDDPIGRAGALMDLAAVLRIAGRGSDAAEMAAQAIGLFAAKGSTVAESEAFAWLGGLSGPPSSTARPGSAAPALG